jgi:hypothetical protein
MSIHWGGRGAGHISRWSLGASGSASLELNFLSGTLDPRVTFTRASTATFVGSNGLIQTAAIDAPRFDYNPATLAARGLLIEEQRANIILQSETFDTGSWNKINATVNANVSVSPTGASTGDALVENTTNGSHGVQQFISFTSGLSYTISCYVKAGTRSWVRIFLPSAAFAGGASSFYNLSGAGALGTSSGTFTGRSITAVGNGWYRVTITATATTTTGGNTGIVAGFADNNFSYVGVAGAEALYLWGAQGEAGAFVTSYIPTVFSTVTRNADIATITGANFSSWYNASEGTFVAKYGASPNLFATYLAASNGVVAQNSVHFDNDSGGTMRVVYYSGSSPQATLSLGAYGAAGTVNTVATAYSVNNFAASRNGGIVETDTSGAVPVSVSQLNIGADPSGAAVNVTNSHIVSITFYKTRLLNSQLQALSV